MFKINVAQNVLMLNGEEAKFGPNPLSFRQVIVQALTTVADGDQFNPTESRLYRVALAHRAQTQDIVELSLTDVLAIAPLITRTFSHPLILAGFTKLLEQSLNEPGSLLPKALTPISDPQE